MAANIKSGQKMATFVIHTVSMTSETESVESELSTRELSVDDPRHGLSQVLAGVHQLFASASADAGNLSKPTPCTEYNVGQLMDHMTFVAKRVSAMGRGRRWEDVAHVNVEADRAEAFKAATMDVRAAWDDTAKLEQMYNTPFGEAPGAAVMFVYTCEFGVHGWDLAQAIGADFSVADEALQGALAASKTLPAEGRDDPDMPFGPVVEVPDDAPALLQIAGWMGRPVLV